jgi:hypothetical protein
MDLCERQLSSVFNSVSLCPRNCVEGLGDLYPYRQCPGRYWNPVHPRREARVLTIVSWLRDTDLRDPTRGSDGSLLARLSGGAEGLIVKVRARKS